MAVLARRPADNLIAPDQILDFDGKDKVYHTVYFRQEQTVKFIRECFGMDKMTVVDRGVIPRLPGKRGEVEAVRTSSMAGSVPVGRLSHGKYSY
jgi:hypothetical protein